MSPAARSPGALVIGADYRALGVVRSLGRRGVPVRVLAAPGEPLAATSRYARVVGRWPRASDEMHENQLLSLARRLGLDGAVLIPSGDESAAFIARRHAQLATSFRPTVPPWQVLRWAYDKRLTYALAARLGIDHPRTRPADGPPDGLDFPLILKPAVKPAANALTTAKAWRVGGPQELAERLREAQALMAPEELLLQELVPGPGNCQLSYVALCRDGAPLAELTAQRTRQYPPDFGRASTYVETATLPELFAPSRALLAELRYTGLIEIEYKRDPLDGAVKLLDMNPRVWGWHSACSDAGVDFPWLLWLLATGAPVPRTTPRDGVRWLRFSTDTPMAIREVLGGRLEARAYLHSLRWPRSRPILAWDDPLPGLIELPSLAFELARRLVSGGPV